MVPSQQAFGEVADLPAGLFPEKPEKSPWAQKKWAQEVWSGLKIFEPTMRQLRRDFILSYFLELILGTGEKFALELFYPFSGIRFYFFSRRIGSADRPRLGDYRYAV